MQKKMRSTCAKCNRKLYREKLVFIENYHVCKDSCNVNSGSSISDLEVSLKRQFIVIAKLHPYSNVLHFIKNYEYQNPELDLNFSSSKSKRNATRKK